MTKKKISKSQILKLMEKERGLVSAKHIAIHLGELDRWNSVEVALEELCKEGKLKKANITTTMYVNLKTAKKEEM